MAKFLMLSNDPNVRWTLTDDADLGDIGSKLFQALEHGHEPEREGWILTIPVVVDGKQTAVHVRERDLSVAAVVEVPAPEPSITNYARDLGRR